MSTFHKKFTKGQGLIEYSLILVLVGIVSILVLKILGPQIGEIFSTINSSLGLDDAVAAAPTALPENNSNGYTSVGNAQAAYCASNPVGHGNTYLNPSTGRYIDIDWGATPPAGYTTFVVHQHCS